MQLNKNSKPLKPSEIKKALTAFLLKTTCVVGSRILLMAAHNKARHEYPKSSSSVDVDEKDKLIRKPTSLDGSLVVNPY